MCIVVIHQGKTQDRTNDIFQVQISKKLDISGRKLVLHLHIILAEKKDSNFAYGRLPMLFFFSISGKLGDEESWRRV